MRNHSSGTTKAKSGSTASGWMFQGYGQKVGNVSDNIRSLLSNVNGNHPNVGVDLLSGRLRDGAEPVRCKARKHPPEYREFMEKHIKELFEAGLIYKNKRSRWCCTPLVVKKRGINQFHMTADVQQVNDRTERMVWPIPMMEVIMENLKGVKAFFSLDFFKVYWQFPLQKTSQEYFSFLTDSGVYYTPRES